MPTMDEMNASLKAAVRERLDATPSDDHKMQGYEPRDVRKSDEDLQQKGLASVDEFLARVDELSQRQDLSQENYSDDHRRAGVRNTTQDSQQNQHVTLGYDADTLRKAKEHMDARAEHYSEWTPPAYAVPGERPTVAERTLQSALEAVRDRHGKYGPPNEHFGRTASLVNAAFGTTFSAADWALVMVLDKVARLRGPTPTTDGGVDIAGYGGCYEECRSTLP